MANLRLLVTEEHNPGDEAWIQLELHDPIVTVRGDRYILRRPSPGETLGGGVIVDHQPRGRHKRFDEGILKSLESISQGTPADVLLEAALALNIASIQEVVTRSRLETNDATSALEDLLSTNSLIPLEEGPLTIASDHLVIALPHWTTLHQKVMEIVEWYHRTFPLRRGIPREELKSRLKLSSHAFNALVTKLTNDHLLIDYSTLLAKPEHEIQFDSGQQATVQALIRRFEQNPFSPPSVKDLQTEVDQEILNALIESNELIAVSSDVMFRKPDYDSMVDTIKKAIQQKGKITLSEVRDLFSTSRKYAQALLEHLDAIGVTVREGDYRKLKK
jgi:selenocysteine-specific elongation factor